MKKMTRFQVLTYGFQPFFSIPTDDRLTVEGKDFNDFAYGSGWSQKKAMQFAVELIQEKSGVEASKELLKAVEQASDEENGDQTFSLAIRFFYDRSKEDAERDANIDRLCKERHERLEAQALEGVDMEPALC